jgi:hypothetical protein
MALQLLHWQAAAKELTASVVKRALNLWSVSKSGDIEAGQAQL